MPSDLDNLRTRRSNLLAELAALNAAASGGKPSYSLDGQQIDHTQYRLSLYDELDAITRQIAALEGPYENQARGAT